jgi:hypothetical protein
MGVPLHLRWQPRPWLVLLALAALAPAAALWTAALANSLGIMPVLTLLPAPTAATSRPERLLLMDTFLLVMLALPLLAVLCGVLATMSLDLRIAMWEVTASLRLSAPAWTLAQVAAAVLLLLGAVLFLAMAGHLAADCVFGTDCVPG